jgi:hypothetical protein
MTNDQVERIVGALERLVEGDARRPAGVESVCMALTGPGIPPGQDGSIAGALNRIADGLHEIAEALAGCCWPQGD